VFCRLVDGSLTGLDDSAIIEAVAAELGAETGEGHPDGESDQDPDDDGPGPDLGGPAPDGPASGGGPGSGGSPRGGPDLDGPEPVGREPDAPPGRTGEPEVGEPDPDPPDVPGSRLRLGIVEVRLQLTTLLGLDDLPGTAPTWGALNAAQARALALSRPGGEWRVVLCDDDGRPTHVLLVRRRPTNAPRHRRDGRDGTAIVELAVRTSDLIALDPADDDPFAPIVREAQAALPGLPALGDPDHPANTRSDAHRRRPGAELRRWLSVRDRWCIGPACHGPAATAEADHTRDWAHSGLTVASNNGLPCGAHHRAKSDRRWKLQQPLPGHFCWTSPAGVRYETRPRRAIPLLPRPLARRRAGPPSTAVPGDRERHMEDRSPPKQPPHGPTDRPRDHTRALLMRSRHGARPDELGVGPDPPF
jgi:hypothetical protein